MLPMRLTTIQQNQLATVPMSTYGRPPPVRQLLQYLVPQFPVEPLEMRIHLFRYVILLYAFTYLPTSTYVGRAT